MNAQPMPGQESPANLLSIITPLASYFWGPKLERKAMWMDDKAKNYRKPSWKEAMFCRRAWPVRNPDVNYEVPRRQAESLIAPSSTWPLLLDTTQPARRCSSVPYVLLTRAEKTGTNTWSWVFTATMLSEE